jgi:uncharacterized protein YbbC (DUF1343 family)
MNTLNGIDVLLNDPFQPLRGLRVGLLTHLAATDRHLHTTHERFAIGATGAQLSALFAPEHGMAGAEQDGVAIETQTDRLSGVPIYSLYGASTRPTPEMLAGLDALVCDLVDIGVRYYTFLWTLSHFIEAAGEAGLPVYILDRPNPQGGRVAGRGLDARFASLVGRYDIPILHGMSLGEMAHYLNAVHNPKPAEIQVIPCANWRRDLPYAQTGLTWVAPSPNMPTLGTALHYGGACWLEGTNLSEGRGTAQPFQIVGAPFMDAYKLAGHFNRQGWAGVAFRPHVFKPLASKYAAETCYGVQLHITDPRHYDPLSVWLGVIHALKRAYGEQISWLPHFDLLMGTDDVRLQLDAGARPEDILSEWEVNAQSFAHSRANFLLYD